VVIGRFVSVVGGESEPTFIRRFGVDGREGPASSILNLTKKKRYEFDIEPQLERTLSGRGAFSPANLRALRLFISMFPKLNAGLDNERILGARRG
jgi:hypothetical protein